MLIAFALPLAFALAIALPIPLLLAALAFSPDYNFKSPGYNKSLFPANTKPV